MPSVARRPARRTRNSDTKIDKIVKEVLKDPPAVEDKDKDKAVRGRSPARHNATATKNLARESSVSPTRKSKARPPATRSWFDALAQLNARDIMPWVVAYVIMCAMVWCHHNWDYVVVAVMMMMQNLGHPWDEQVEASYESVALKQ